MDSDDGGTKRSGRGRGRTKNTRGRGRGRGKKTTRVISSDEEEEVASPEPEQGIVALPVKRSTASKEPATIAPSERLMGGAPVELNPEPLPVTSVLSAPSSAPLIIDMEADISQLEAPTFTTISRGPPEPMVRLTWNHKVNLIGEKVLNPMIYCCDRCENPILIYGRMIPCKHVFCLRCARSETFKVCPRCSEKVVRVEQTHLGTVFMCTHGGTRHGNTGCRRTYLSQRDLQAHINHRHVTNLVPQEPLPQAPPTIQPLVIPPSHQIVPIQPMELSPLSKMLSEKVNSGGVASLRKSSCEQLNSPRSGMMRPSDSYYSYGSSNSYNTSHIVPNQQLHMPIGVSQQSPVQQHLSRTGYSPYRHQTSSPQQQHTQSSTAPSISSTLWSQSTSQYYR